jgi:hypothetical protein
VGRCWYPEPEGCCRRPRSLRSPGRSSTPYRWTGLGGGVESFSRALMRVYMCVCLQCAGMQKYLETQRLDEVWALGRSDGARAEHVEERLFLSVRKEFGSKSSLEERVGALHALQCKGLPEAIRAPEKRLLLW